jgi:BirA family biotin operon repressor/biotin-[acetyl-CoA-carboxylase] ligase
MRSDILDLLRKAGGKYISGEEIASRLGVSRTAVWKHIRELRTAGYHIESHSRSGYALLDVPDLLLPGEIRYGLQTKLIGQDIIFHEQIDSTNNEAKRIAAQGAPDGTVVVAEEQGTGRGRLERKFFSPPGKGIWFSVILHPDFPPQDAPKCTLMSSVAVAMAMEKFGLQAGIKWPNDILYEGKKLVGILTELSAEMDHINYVVIGTGINVNIWPDDFPEELRGSATSLAIMKGSPLPRVKFFQAVLEAMDGLYASICTEGFGAVIQAWKRYTITLGQAVNVIGVGDNESFSGMAADIDDDGALLVDTDKGRRRVLAGDVSIRPKV